MRFRFTNYQLWDMLLTTGIMEEVMNSIEKYLEQNNLTLLEFCRKGKGEGVYTAIVKAIMGGNDCIRVLEIKNVARILGIKWYELVIEFYI